MTCGQNLDGFCWWISGFPRGAIRWVDMDANMVNMKFQLRFVFSGQGGHEEKVEQQDKKALLKTIC